MASRFRAAEHATPGAGAPVFLVQEVEDPYYYGLFCQLAASLRASRASRAEGLWFRSFNVGEWDSLRRFAFSRLVAAGKASRAWGKLYSAALDGRAYSSVTFRPFADLADLYHAVRFWKSITDKRDVLAWTVDGIVLGDLAYDSYLRFRPAPTVDVKDPYLAVVLWQALRDVRRARSYLARTRPRFLLTSYSTYVQHGVPVRVALSMGIAAYSFGNLQEAAKELEPDDTLHTRDARDYQIRFAGLSGQAEKLAVAEEALAARISGALDGATGYMRASAYADSGEDVPVVDGEVVVFLHDFYDSPHVYEDMIFADFWAWISFTIRALEAAQIPYWLKPHPNQVDLSDAAIETLRAEHPRARFISTRVTNRQLASAGMACGITVYGTVCHELAYMGVRSIACARHPHASFGFTETARSLADYTVALENCLRVPVDKGTARAESLAFYCMHNLDGSAGDLELRDELNALRAALAADRISPEDAAGRFTELTQLPGWRALVDRLAEKLS
jgi:hypothetical protein